MLRWASLEVWAFKRRMTVLEFGFVESDSTLAIAFGSKLKAGRLYAVPVCQRNERQVTPAMIFLKRDFNPIRGLISFPAHPNIDKEYHINLLLNP